MYENVVRSYQQTQFLTANPLKLILMCYDGAIDYLKAAKSHYLAKEYEKKSRDLQMVLDIIHELLQSLDFQKGGQIAKNLNALYLYMIQRIVDGDIKRDVTAFDEVILYLEDLADAWREIICGDHMPTTSPTKPLTDNVENKETTFRGSQV
jgi:flagellar protein FliS